MRAQFPASRRLQTDEDFKQVFRRATRITSKYITLVTRENNLGRPRLGISLSKRNIRHAVDRNRIKRVARETFRAIQGNLSNWDVVVIAYKGAESLSHKDQQQQFRALWEKFMHRCAPS